jgi:DNA (cytosine-5)-methyltransferase 1
MHTINHPYTKHYCESVWKVDPVKACNGRRVKLAWFSPDCTHFTKARGTKPKSKKIRGLAWLAVRWIKRLKPTNQHPELIVMENVEEFQTWGPLLPCGQPCPDRAGDTFHQFIDTLKEHGYSVDWRELRACDYGAPTIRKRLFIIARRDGQPIIWPEPTHGKGLKPYRTAAECIDWSVPTKSIFNRKRPLAENTLRRIAKGIERFVLDTPKPFIVPIQNYGGGRALAHNIDEPLRTITAYPKGGAFALVAPSISEFYGASVGRGVDGPLGTATTQNKHGLLTASLQRADDLVVPHIAKHYTGVVGHELKKPLGTITTVDHHSLVTSKLVKAEDGIERDNSDQVRAFLIKYYSSNIGLPVDTPLHTITTKHRFGLVTVKGQDYRIADIGLRMLTPRELFNANDFPDDYIIEHDHKGKRVTIKDQVARCGNSVPPAFARAIVSANINDNQEARAA